MRTKAGFWQHVEKFSRAHALLKKGMGIVVACSGGPDSLVLADVLARWQPKYRLRLVIAHFEHGIRGAASREDAAFVRSWCEEKHLPFAMEAADVPRLAREAGTSVETMGRELRYAFLERVRLERGMDVIATAHHADDQAETVLMHILRGTGLQGLAGIRPRRGCIIRPLLGVTKADILAYAEQAGLNPREDVTNAMADCLRNRVRLELLPHLRQSYNPAITRALCQLADIAADEQELALGHVPAMYLPLDCQAFRRLGTPSQRIVVRRLWQEATGSTTDLPWEAVERVRSLAVAGAGSQQLPHHFLAQVHHGALYLTSQH